MPAGAELASGSRVVSGLLLSELVACPNGMQDHDLLDFESALAAFEVDYPRAAKAVELRYYAGFSPEEAADALGVSEPTVRRDLVFARAWLHDRLAH